MGVKGVKGQIQAPAASRFESTGERLGSSEDLKTVEKKSAPAGSRTYRILIRKSGGRQTLGRTRRRWQDYIKMYL